MIFFILVLVASSYTTYNLSKEFLLISLETKNQVIDQKQKDIERLIKQNEYQMLVNDSLKDIIKVGIKSGCIKRAEYEQIID